ncbi:hypothetical protein [Leptospira borgpetersenii]|nr:hypothetical protein [Leptospira borgpetersenii]
MKDPYKLGEIILEREIRFTIGKSKIHPEPDIGCMSSANPRNRP